MTIDEIIEINPDAIIIDGFDKAIVGMVERIDMQPIVVYSTKKIIEILTEQDEMSHEEAVEFYEYNILGAFVGENGPMFLIEEI